MFILCTKCTKTYGLYGLLLVGFGSQVLLECFHFLYVFNKHTVHRPLKECFLVNMPLGCTDCTHVNYTVIMQRTLLFIFNLKAKGNKMITCCISFQHHMTHFYYTGNA